MNMNKEAVDLAHRPIEDEYLAMMNSIAKTLDDIFNGVDCAQGDKKTGFALLVFPFEDITGTGRVNYISNADREDMLTSMKEFIARNEGRYMGEGGNA